MKCSLKNAGLLALGMGSLASALPSTGKPTGKKSVKSGVFEVKHDQALLKKALAIQQSSGHNKTLGARGTYGPYDLDYAGYWFSDIVIDGQTVSLLLDTGSADLWVLPPSNSGDSQGYGTWNPSAGSHTTQMSGENFDIGYGEGGNGVSGPVYQAPVCMGYICVYMAVGSATYDQNIDFARSGIMGMAFKGGNSIRPTQQDTFPEQLIDDGALDQPIFSFKMSATGGEIALGEVPFDYEAPFQEIQVDLSSNAPYPYSWSYTDIEYSVNGENLGTFDVVFDSGGPMTSAAIGIVRGYYAQVPGAVDVNGDGSSWTAPCGETLPDLRLDFTNGAFLIIPGYRFFHGNTATSGQCTVWFVKENSATRAVIGDPFFDEHVVVFNQNTGAIQWANQS